MERKIKFWGCSITGKPCSESTCPGWIGTDDGYVCLNIHLLEQTVKSDSQLNYLKELEEAGIKFEHSKSRPDKNYRNPI